MKNQIFLKDYRIQFLNFGIVRLEKKVEAGFYDKDSFFVPQRPELACGAEEDLNGVLSFNGYSFKTADGFLKNLKIFNSAGKNVYRYKQLNNSGELPKPCNTPEIFAVNDCPRISVPEYGYSPCGKDELNGFKIDEKAEDVYLLLCNKDAKLLRRQYVELTGRSEMVRLSTLGLWDSRWYDYTEETAKQRIADYESHKVPLDNLVLDTGWRSCEKGWGYDVNTELLPDLKRLFDYAHKHNVSVMFNDHPEPLNGTKSILDPGEVKYREENLQKLLSMGLDIWWYDRNWQTKLISPTEAIKCETWGMYAYSEITKHFYENRDGKYFSRPDIMANVNNVNNGKYASHGSCSILDSASHRYSIQWTGDIPSDYSSLKREIASMIDCGSNGIVYINADCGGHYQDPTEEQYIRWIQFGAFSPVLRPHCNKNVVRTREPWAYENKIFNIAKEFIKLRYRMLPVIYKNCYESYISGMPIFKSLGFDYPDDKKAGESSTQYMLGNDLLIAPVLPREDVYSRVPEKNFVSPVKATYYSGRKWEGEPIAHAVYRDIFFHWYDEKPEKNVPAYDFSSRFETKLRFDKDTELVVESDDGVRVYIDGVIVHDDITENGHSAIKASLGKLEGGRTYDMVLEHFQGSQFAAIALYTVKRLTEKQKSEQNIYLPQGEWIDVFDGKTYHGKKYINKKYALEVMPLFARKGAVIPVAYNSENTACQKWDKLIYDFYPSETATEEGYLYEDDGKTVAYKYGKCRKTNYRTHYDSERNAYVLNFEKGIGVFEGERYCNMREVSLRCHTDEEVKHITINGKDVAFEVVARNKTEMPFNDGKAVPDGKCVLVRFEQSTEKDYEIIIYKTL